MEYPYRDEKGRVRSCMLGDSPARIQSTNAPSNIWMLLHSVLPLSRVSVLSCGRGNARAAR